jgi:nucleotide-binding universal stress UspA family protein
MTDACPSSRLERILVATDGSKFSEAAIAEAINMAKVCLSKLFIIAVIEANPEFEALAPQLMEKAEQETHDYLQSLKAKAKNEGIDCDTISHEGEEPYKFIVEEAEKNKIDMIVMGSHGRTGLKRLLMGSVTARVIGHAPCKVLVVPC